MVKQKPETITPRARALGAAIRSVRKQAGFTSRELGRRLGLSHAMISHWETGRRVPGSEDAASLLTAIGLSGDQKRRIMDLARGATEPNWLTYGEPSFPQQLNGVLECERAADSIFEWSPLCVPGLLQTPAYARATMLAFGLSAEEAEHRVTLRIVRRDLITCRTPAAFEAHVGEAALRDLIGTPEVMSEQLHLLLRLAVRTNITIRVVPSRAGWHPGLAGRFVFYEFDKADPVVHFEHSTTGAFVHAAYDVSRYRVAIEGIRAVAMSAPESASFISDLGEQLSSKAS
jgi:transcriptional regulator with XRE-family HTH domain